MAAESALCEVPDCGKFAVIYDPKPDWNLCAEHTHDRMAYLSISGHQPPRGAHRVEAVLGRLERRGIVTTDPTEAEKCCGIERDEDGFCQHREHHPIYVGSRT